MGDKHRQQRQGWKNQVELWRSSGVSASAWCRQHNLSYQSFLYWKKCFTKQRCGKFIEIKDEGPGYTGVSLEAAGFDHSAGQRL